MDILPAATIFAVFSAVTAASAEPDPGEEEDGFILSGTAKMGAVYDRSLDSRSSVHFETAIEVLALGRTDSDLEFGAVVTIESIVDDETGTGENEAFDPRVFISGGFGTVTAGALDPATDQLGLEDIGFDGAGGLNDVAEEGKVVGSANVGYELSLENVLVLVTAHTVNDDFGAVLGYVSDSESFSLALGYDYGDSTSSRSAQIDVAASRGPFFAEAFYVAYSEAGEPDRESYGVSAAFSAEHGVDYRVTLADSDAAEFSYGVGAAYDLGGGLILAGSAGKVDGATTMDFGVEMSF